MLRIETDLDFTFKYYSEIRQRWVNTHLRNHNHLGEYEHLVSIRWKFNPDHQCDSDPNSCEFEVEESNVIRSALSDLDRKSFKRMQLRIFLNLDDIHESLHLK